MFSIMFIVSSAAECPKFEYNNYKVPKYGRFSITANYLPDENTQYSYYYRINESEWIKSANITSAQKKMQINMKPYENIYGNSLIDIAYNNGEGFECIERYISCACMPLQVHNISMAPYFYVPNSVPNILAYILDFNYNPTPTMSISINNDESNLDLQDVTSDNNYFVVNYPSIADEDDLIHIQDVGNYTAEITFYEQNYDATTSTTKDVEFYIRNQMDINYIKSDKEYYYNGESATLTFQFSREEDADTWYNVYANNVKEVKHDTKGETFEITIHIPEDTSIGEYTVTYNVSIGDVIWSSNHETNLNIRSKPVLSNLTHENHYIITEQITISVSCADEDENEKFKIYYKVGEDAEFTAISNLVNADPSKITKLDVNINASHLRHGTNDLSIKVVDKFNIESDPISTSILIVSAPDFNVTEQLNFYQAGDDVTLNIELIDQDDNDYANLYYSFGDTSGDPVFLEKITIPQEHTYSGQLKTFKIPDDAEAGSLNLKLSATDSYGYTTTKSITLTIHQKPTFIPSIEHNLAPGKTYKVTFTISDGDLPNDEITFAYKIGNNDYQNVLTYTDGKSKEFSITIPSDLPSGDTTLSIKATDLFSLFSEETLNIHIKEKPEITVENLQTTNYIGGMTVELKGTYSDGDDDQGKVHVESSISTLTSDQLNSGDSFNISLVIPENQPVGPVIVKLYSEDSDNLNSSEQTITFNVRYAPKFGECSYDKTTYKPGDSVTVTCTISDEDDGDTISYGTYDSTNDQFTQQSQKQMTSNTIELEFGPFNIPQDYSSSSYDLNFRAIDSFGFKGDKLIQILLRNKPVITYETANQQYYLRGETMVLKGYITDDDNTDTVEIVAKYGSVTNSSQLSTEKGVRKPFELSLTIPSDAEIGTMVITLSATDSYNISADVVTVNLPLYFRPIIKATAPTTLFKPDETATIEIEIEDHDPSESIELMYKYEGMDDYINISGISIDSQTGKTTKGVDVKLPSQYSGDLCIEFKAIDSHSLTSNIEIANVTIRNIPQLNLDSEIRTVVQGHKLTISGFIIDQDTEDLFTFYIDNSPYNDKLTRTAEKTTFSIEVPVTDVTTGARTLDLYVVDKYTLESEHKTVNFNMRAVPVVEINPITGKYHRGSNIEFTIKIKDEDEGDSSLIQIKYENNNIQSLSRKLHEEVRIPTTPDFQEHTLKIAIPNDSKFGNVTIEIVAVDTYNLSSIPATTKVYVITPPQLSYEGNDRSDIKQGDNVITTFKVKDIDGDNTITISLKLPNGTVIGPITDECQLDSEMKSSCNDKEHHFDIYIPDSAKDGEFPIVATLNDTYGQLSTIQVKLDVMNYPPEMQILNINELQQTPFAINDTVTVKYHVRDNNTDDISYIYVSLYNTTQLLNDSQPYATFNSTKEWSEHEFNFEIPSNFTDGPYTVSLYAVDKNGKKSDVVKSTVIVDSAKKAQGNSIDGFRIIVDKKWIIMVIIAALIALILLIVLIVIILLIPCGEEKEEEEEIPEVYEDDDEVYDSGETVSVTSDEVEEYDVRLIPTIEPNEMVDI